MLSFLELFRFRRRDSPIHRMDPRVKALYLLVMSTLSIVYYSLAAMLTLFASTIPLIAVAGVHREWIRSLRGAAFLASMIIFVNMIAGYLSEGFILTMDTISYALSMGLRFLTFTSVFSIFFLTTTPEDLSLALEKLGVPYDYCFAFTSAIRFVPDLALEIQTVIDAQRSRGLELEKGNLIRRVRNYIPILIPVFIRSFTRSIELAEAMEARGYGASEKRTSIYELCMKRSDYMIALLLLCILALSILIRLLIGWY
ncbi:MAG: energy-coupling factor transporter transmembrane component T [Candidatus Bathyarchaeia archaeon]